MKKIGTLPLLLILFLDVSTEIKGYRAPYEHQWTSTSDYAVKDEPFRAEQRRSHIPKRMDILMPNVSPQKHDTYFCIATKMPEEETFIVGYEPQAKMQTAHHMLMFGCDEVDRIGSADHWDCGEMGGTCSGSVNKVMYAWAKDAPPLDLKKYDVGFRVGGKSRIKYIVLQVHYANVDKFKHHHKTDHSGVILHLQTERPKYFAGIYLVAAGGPPIPARQPVFHMDMACRYDVGPDMHPFAFRVHAHKLGVVVTGFRVEGDNWTMIGKGDPQRAQAFYDVASSARLKAGDILAARCTYDSSKRDRITYIGATGDDEMCNFYMMYRYDPRQGLSTDACSRVQMRDDLYPSYTDEPLPPEPEMNMKRSAEDDEDLLLFSEE